MAVTRKQDNKNNKREQGKKEVARKEPVNKNPALNKDKKESAKKDLVISKDKRDIAKKAPGKKEVAVKKENINRGEQLRKFLRGTVNELKKVHWPNRREVIIYTSVVLVAVAAVGVLIWIFDSALSSVLKLILSR